MQKRASGGSGVSQTGQRRSSAAPQDMQKRAPSGFSYEQLEQGRGTSHVTISAPRQAVRDVCCTSRPPSAVGSPQVNALAYLPITPWASYFRGGTAVKEYRDEAMKHLEAAERDQPSDPQDVQLAIASSLVAIAETLHAIRASLDKLAA
jgi:hypothetical protein